MYELWNITQQGEIFIMSAPLGIILNWCDDNLFSEVKIKKVGSDGESAS
jgi:hypothetical protein